MSRFYSQATGNTYIASVHGTHMPGDATPIDEDRYFTVIANPEPGKIRSHDAVGLPILIDPVAPTDADREGQERHWRDSKLDALVWLRDRHRDQLEIEVATTLTAEQFTDLLVSMQALRDWPQSPDFPDSQHRPTAPPWLAEQPE